MGKIMISLCAMILFSGLSVFAQYPQPYGQCNRSTSTPIQCGYYEEGYQDGVSDAQNNRNNDYKRYRAKLDGSRYENFYKQGYDAGYVSLKPYQRWDKDQKDNYDDGFRDGENDKRRGISRLPERYEGQYNKSYEVFYRQGYFDGYDGKTRQYDMPIGGIPTYPTNPTNPTYPANPTGIGTATGTINWSGRVDDRVNIVIQGSDVKTQLVSGNNGQPNEQLMNGVLPRRASIVTVNKTDGRGTAFVIQQPSRENKYTAIVQVFDSKRGADEYRLQISWQSTALIEEPYQAGRVTWRGKVDQTANIIISGNDVQTQNISGTGVSSVKYQISGYLAFRPGTVSLKKNKGRGTVSILQQPSAENDYVAIIQVFDADGGYGEYEFDVTW